MMFELFLIIETICYVIVLLRDKASVKTFFFVLIKSLKVPKPNNNKCYCYRIVVPCKLRLSFLQFQQLVKFMLTIWWSGLYIVFHHVSISNGNIL